MPEVWRAPKGFVVSFLALAMPGVVCGGPACQDPRVGQRDSRKGSSRAGLKAADLAAGGHS